MFCLFVFSLLVFSLFSLFNLFNLFSLFSLYSLFCLSLVSSIVSNRLVFFFKKSVRHFKIVSLTRRIQAE